MDYGLNLLDDHLHRDALLGTVSMALAKAMQDQASAVAEQLSNDVKAGFTTLSDCADRLQAQVAVR